jgi:acyl carrier protein
METLEQWDSIAHINICLAIQNEFNVDMSIDEISDCTSISALAAMLEKKRAS